MILKAEFPHRVRAGYPSLTAVDTDKAAETVEDFPVLVVQLHDMKVHSQVFSIPVLSSVSCVHRLLILNGIAQFFAPSLSDLQGGLRLAIHSASNRCNSDRRKS